MTPKDDAQRQAILDACLRAAPFDGWHESMLVKASIAAGYDENTALRLFPGGARAVLRYWMTEADQAMADDAANTDLAAMKIRQRIAWLVQCRLALMQPHREALRRALAQQSLSVRGGRSLKSLYHTVDRMWRLAGDDSTDFNFYTKRGLLAGVYSSTLLFWLNDDSEAQQESWAFLDRRIQGVMGIQKTMARLRKIKPGTGPWRCLGRLRYARQARQ